MTQYRFRTWHLALVGAAFLSQLAWAAPEKVDVTGSIKLHLRSDRAQPNDGSTSPVDVWVIDVKELSRDLSGLTLTATPDAPQIVAAVRKYVQDQATPLIHDTTHLTLAPAALFQTPANVDNSGFLSRLAPGDQGSCDGAQAPLPAPPGPPQCRVVSLEVSITPVKSITIRLTTADSGAPLQAFNGTFVELASKLHLKQSADGAAISFSIRLSEHDVPRDSSGEPDFTEALRVVDQVQAALDNAKGGIGAPADNGTPFGPLGKFPTVLLSGPFEADEGPAGKVAGLTAKQPFTLKDNPTNLIVELTGAKFPHAVRFQPGEGAQALTVVEKHHLETFRRRLVGNIVRGTDIGRALYELKTDPYVKDVHFKYDENSLVFIISTRTVSKNLKLSGGAGYSPEKNGYGVFAADLDNFDGRGDKTETNVKLGPNIADVSLAATIPETPQPFNAGFHFLGLSAGGGYQFDNKTHYQVAGADRTTDQQKMLSGNVKLGLDSFSLHDHSAFSDATIPHRKRIQHLLTLTPSYEIGLLTTTDRKTQQSLTDGQITAFSAQPAYVLDWDLRSNNCSCGLSELRLQLDSALTKGARWLGGDFAFDSAQASGSFELTFGTREPYEYLLRGRAGAGSASRGTPLPRLFQIGGPDYVRGLERGEFTANTLLWQQAEAGPSLNKLWSWIQALRPSHKKPAACADATSPQLPFNLRTSYLALFYDHARVAQGTSLPNVLDQRASASVQGYGAALELGKVKNVMNISLGYGYSPQSQLHRHGVMFVGVTLR